MYTRLQDTCMTIIMLIDAGNNIVAYESHNKMIHYKYNYRNGLLYQGSGNFTATDAIN